jgi:hypothetical protein
MSEIEVVLFCPNSKLLTEPWDVVAKDILRARSQRAFISNVIYMAKCLGEINRYYSSKLPDKYLKVLMKRMTELRKIVRKASSLKGLPKGKDLIPWEHMEYLYSGCDRTKMKR